MKLMIVRTDPRKNWTADLFLEKSRLSRSKPQGTAGSVTSYHFVASGNKWESHIILSIRICIQ